MVVTIENPVELYGFDYLRDGVETHKKNAKYYNDSLVQFALICQDILIAEDEIEVKANLRHRRKLGEINNFKYGFGGSHLWVKQVDPNGELSDRIILVTF